MKDQRDVLDPKGLIREAYRIEGIVASQCRSIFLDWALSLPDGQDSREAIAALLERYAEQPDDHPMTHVLREGMTRMTAPKRRGGWRSRPRD
ncbi:hypothetical protein TRL7639_02350 [Falsiruegeria litorea R37]|uniref:Uncharacterized protein n=1 Tax=Falsiruegeria litorea R37 TaxID=1200284 RepID=A0A1Y5SMS6_9RHOB|nr:hypothetical protein [Falsiruegeria litorea]SLN44334.1 hypothetical protein TRL7639_02350 [Falsiruegeria litorea R37]